MSILSVMYVATLHLYREITGFYQMFIPSRTLIHRRVIGQMFLMVTDSY